MVQSTAIPCGIQDGGLLPSEGIYVVAIPPDSLAGVCCRTTHQTANSAGFQQDLQPTRIGLIAARRVQFVTPYLRIA
jgi:hypothetical protein